MTTPEPTGALAVECPHCGAKVSEPCKGKNGKSTKLHAARAANGDADQPSMPPAGLGEAGRELWASIMAGLPDSWEFDERESALLLLAAKQADVVANLEKVVEDDGLMATGSTGQPIVHPAIAEARQGRQAIERMLGKVTLPLPEKDGETSASGHGRQAANARWADEARRKARSNG